MLSAPTCVFYLGTNMSGTKHNPIKILVGIGRWEKIIKLYCICAALQPGLALPRRIGPPHDQKNKKRREMSLSPQ
uniref:Uncharacterized protein n=1 Tax=Rhizophora mucronata TaxID=61149 RepID=A0A2P2KP84_RHIMU